MQRVLRNVDEHVPIADPVDQVRDPSHVIRRLFDRDDRLLIGELREHLRGDVDPVGGRVVVAHDRETAGA